MTWPIGDELHEIRARAGEIEKPVVALDGKGLLIGEGAAFFEIVSRGRPKVMKIAEAVRDQSTAGT